MTGGRQSPTIPRQWRRHLPLSSLSMTDYQSGSRIDAVVKTDFV